MFYFCDCTSKHFCKGAVLYQNLLYWTEILLDGGCAKLDCNRLKHPIWLGFGSASARRDAFLNDRSKAMTDRFDKGCDTEIGT